MYEGADEVGSRWAVWKGGKSLFAGLKVDAQPRAKAKPSSFAQFLDFNLNLFFCFFTPS